jgi:alkaline phosphatase
LRQGALLLATALAGRAVRLKAAAEPALRVGLLTDLHYAERPANGTRFYRDGLAKLRACVEKFNQARVHLAVELGDFIDAADTAEGELLHLKTVETEFARLDCERHYALGNHCVWSLTKAQFLGHSGARKEFYSFDRGGFHLVILDGCFRPDGVAYGAKNSKWDESEIPLEQRQWLAADLAKAGGPTLVFVHQRLDLGPPYGVRSAPAVREILEQSAKVLAVFQGHQHQNDHRVVGGIHYCTLAAMVDGTGVENTAYGLMDVYSDGALKLAGFGRQASQAWAGRKG